MAILYADQIRFQMFSDIPSAEKFLRPIVLTVRLISPITIEIEIYNLHKQTRIFTKEIAVQKFSAKIPSLTEVLCLVWQELEPLLHEEEKGALRQAGFRRYKIFFTNDYFGVRSEKLLFQPGMIEFIDGRTDFLVSACYVNLGEALEASILWLADLGCRLEETTC